MLETERCQQCSSFANCYLEFAVKWENSVAVGKGVTVDSRGTRRAKHGKNQNLGGVLLNHQFAIHDPP